VEKVFAAPSVGGPSLTESRVIRLLKACDLGKRLVDKGKEWLASGNHPLPNPLVSLGRWSPLGTFGHFRALCGFFIEQRCHPKLGTDPKIPLIAEARQRPAGVTCRQPHEFCGENVAILSHFGTIDVTRAQSTTCR
jgi:hypothetical protein